MKDCKKVILYNPNPLGETRHSVLAPLPLLAVSKIIAHEGYDIHIISPALYENPHKEVLKHCNDAICLGISSMTGYQIKDGLRLAGLVKKINPELPIVWGGWHPSMEPKQTLQSPLVDIIVRGQGERTFAELVSALKNNKSLHDISGISFKENGKMLHNQERPLEDINNFPPYPYHLIDVKKCLYNTEYGDRTINYISSYGCPHRCNFCEIHTIYKRRWLGLAPEKIVDDIEWLIKNYNIDSIAFHDNNFLVNKKRVKAFCEELIRRGINIKWGNIFGRTTTLLKYDDELWELMKQSGLHHILVGAESAFQDALDFINKDTRAEDTIKFAEQCKRYGIKVIFSFFVGMPWDSDYEKCRRMVEREFEETFNMMDRLIAMDNRHRMILSHYTPYPGSELYYKSVACGFKPPENFEGWGDILLEKGCTPWVPPKLSSLVEMLTTYIFFFMDAESYGWVTKRIENPVLRTLFKGAFKVFEKIVHLRWRFKYFDVPVDFKVYKFARSRGKLFGFYES